MNRVIMYRTYSFWFKRNMCTPAQRPTPDGGSSQSHKINPRYKPSEFQKIILVWTKKFKTKQEIPDFVSLDLIERSRSEARIKIANRLMILTVLASLGAIISGKAAAKRGESVHQYNLDFHKQYREDYEKKHAEK